MTITEPMTRSEHDRLRDMLPQRTRFDSEAIRMAQAAVELYGGRKLSNRQDYHAFFREVVPELYATAHNVAAAAMVLDILIAERKANETVASVLNRVLNDGMVSRAEFLTQLDGRNG